MILEAFKTEKQKRRSAFFNNLGDFVFKILDSLPMKLAYAIFAIALITAVDESKHEKTLINETTYRH
ncbi:hypothetical protein [Pseudomonas extremaustralis]